MEETILDDYVGPEKPKPKIYSAFAVRAFGFLFSNIFGGVMLYKNLKAIHENGAAQRALLYSVLTTAAIILISNVPGSPGGSLTVGLNAAGSFGLAQYYFQKYFPNAKEYPYRTVWIELLIGIVILAVFIGVPILLIRYMAF